MCDAGAEDERFMREALIEASLAADEGEVPIGAVVVCEGRVIARAHNRRESDNDPSAHAEFSAMLQAAKRLGRWRLTGCTVYVTLEPCTMCAGLMVNSRIDACVFGAADPKGGALGTLYDLSRDDRLNHSFEVRSGVLADLCSSELRRFFSALRAKRSGDPGGVEGPADESPAAPLGELSGESRPQDHASAATCGPYGLAPALQGGVRAMPQRSAAGPLNVLLAIDSFKGSASSAEAEAWLAEGIAKTEPDVRAASVPVADGGEGTIEAFRAALGGELVEVSAHDAFGAEMRASYLMVREPAGSEADPARATSASSGTRRIAPFKMPMAVIEAASVIGIGSSPRTHDAALHASSYGVGELIAGAVAAGARTVLVGLGGTCTTDGGAGALAALGAAPIDAVGGPVQAGLMGLRDVAGIDLAPARRLLREVELVALRDVGNPLVGDRGAVRCFGPQKGLGRCADEACAAGKDRPGSEGGAEDGCDVGCGGAYGGADAEATLATCDRWMQTFGIRLTAARDALDGTSLQVGEPGGRPRSLIGVPGAGAAGGLGAALLAIGARLEPGIDCVLDALGFDELAASASIVVTGEGSLDGQSALGKVPVGVASRVKRVAPGTPVVAVCGGRSDELGPVYEKGVDLVLPVLRRPMALDEAMGAEQTRANLACAGEAVVRALRLAVRR